MINNRNLQWIKNNPFKIFSVNNFLNEIDFNNLRNNFPNFEDLGSENLFNFKNNKFAITSGSPDYNKIILKNETLKNFHDFINSEKFKKYFFYDIYKHILFSRKFNLKHFYKLLKIPKFVDKIDENIFSKNFSIYTKYKISIQYSYILNQGKIVPHPDAGDKVLSLLLFFPQYQNDHKYYEKENSYGTTFWNSNYSNINDQHIDNFEAQTEFKKESKILYKADFSKNNLFGFFKNDYSWHSVEPIYVHDGYIRKSININIYY